MEKAKVWGDHPNPPPSLEFVTVLPRERSAGRKDSLLLASFVIPVLVSSAQQPDAQGRSAHQPQTRRLRAKVRCAP